MNCTTLCPRACHLFFINHLYMKGGTIVISQSTNKKTNNGINTELKHERTANAQTKKRERLKNSPYQPFKAIPLCFKYEEQRALIDR